MTPATLAASSGGNFLVSPNVGVMIWTLIAFGITVAFGPARVPAHRGGPGQAQNDRRLDRLRQRTREEAGRCSANTASVWRRRGRSPTRSCSVRARRRRRTSARHPSRRARSQRTRRHARRGTSRRRRPGRSRNSAGGRRPDDHGDREGHPQDARRPRSEATGRRGAGRAGLLRHLLGAAATSPRHEDPAVSYSRRKAGD